MASSQPVLPLEIYDMIIDELAVNGEGKDYIHDIGKTRMSYGSWSKVEVHRKLKALVDLMRPPVSSKTNALDFRMQGILQYIRHFQFDFCDGGLYNGAGHSQLFRESRDHALDILHLISTPACSLQILQIDGLKYSASWSCLAPGIRSSLLHLCRFTTELRLVYMKDLPKNILRGTIISNLFIEEVEVFDFNFRPKVTTNLELFPEYYDANENTGLAFLPLPKIQHAQIYDLFNVFCDQLYPVDANHSLSMKTMRIFTSCFAQFGQTISRVSGEYRNLQDLWIKIYGRDYNSNIEHFDILHMTFLKNLSIELERFPFQADISDLAVHLTSIWTILRHCSNSSLSAIPILLTDMVLDVKADGSYDMDLDVFRDLDKLLGSGSRFPSLLCFTMYMFIEPRDPPLWEGECLKDAEEEFVDFIRTGFPYLSRRTFNSGVVVDPRVYFQIS